jgi:hypothetical protein
MAGFEDNFTDTAIAQSCLKADSSDCVEIWIYDTCDASCVVYTRWVVRSLKKQLLCQRWAFTVDPMSSTCLKCLSGDESEGFILRILVSCALGIITIGSSPYGPATGKRLPRFFHRGLRQPRNRIHTEFSGKHNGGRSPDGFRTKRHNGFSDIPQLRHRQVCTHAIRDSTPRKGDGRPPCRLATITLAQSGIGAFDHIASALFASPLSHNWRRIAWGSEIVPPIICLPACQMQQTGRERPLVH